VGDEYQIWVSNVSGTCQYDDMCVHEVGKFFDSGSDLELVINSLRIFLSNRKSRHHYHVLPNIRIQYLRWGHS